MIINNKTKGQIEAEISIAFTQFMKEQLGRGPKEARTFIIQDILLIRLMDVLTPAEILLTKEIDGAQLIKLSRMRLIESTRHLIEEMVHKITKVQVTTVHTDISTRTGERIFVLVLDTNLEERLNLQI